MVAAVAAAEAAANNVGSSCLGLCDSGGCRRGNVDDALKWGGTPLPAVKITRGLPVKMIVGQGIPTLERSMVITDTGDVKIVRINSVRADWRRILLTTDERASGYCAKQNQANAFTSFHGPVM